METVRDYLKRIPDKLQVRSRTEAALKYLAVARLACTVTGTRTLPLGQDQYRASGVRAP